MSAVHAATVLTLAGSPSAASRTQALLRLVGARLTADGHRVRHLAVRDLPAAALLHADTADPVLRAAVEAVSRADAVVVGTPVHKASYSGLLKALLDVLPQDALRDKAVLPLTTGGSPAHVLALDYALRPVLTALGADRVLRGRFVLDRHIARDPQGTAVLDPEARTGVEEAVAELSAVLSAAPADALRAA
ncbi:NADPH-dependent FMN reductase [Streptomyces cacaoi]|uniref:NADPH-dependent FMN reductase n=1 Tax=Streptomyces cacaoi TaxID=1898 RepID=UPI0011F1F5A9|nr:NADPH-dependent FMN reductase [Streptomyces cacaoi]